MNLKCISSLAYLKAFVLVLRSSVARRLRVIGRRALQSRLGLGGMVARVLEVSGSIETYGPVFLGHDCSIVVGIGGRLVFRGSNYISDRCLIAVPPGSLMIIGDHVCLQNDTQLQGSISIGAFTVMGAYVYLTSGSHAFRSHEIPAIPIRMQDELFPDRARDAPIVIEEDCWIGANVTVLQGARLGRGAIIGAGSLVTHRCSVRIFEIVAGRPAKHIGWRWNVVDVLPGTPIL